MYLFGTRDSNNCQIQLHSRIGTSQCESWHSTWLGSLLGIRFLYQCKALEILQGEWTALMIAAFKGHADVAIALLSKGADLEARSKVLRVVECTTCAKPFVNTSWSVAVERMAALSH